MSKNYLSRVISMLCVCTMCSCAAYSGPDGYGDIPWGTDIKSFKDDGFIFLGEHQGFAYYNCIGSERSFDNYKPKKVECGFIDGKLKSIYTELAGRSNCYGVKKELIDRYGNPSGGFLDKILRWEVPGTTVLYVERNSGMSCSARISHAATTH